MSGQWLRSNKTTSRKAQLETVYDASRRVKTPVRSPGIFQAIKRLTLRFFEGGGSQLLAFMKGGNTIGPKKTCSGDMRDGDYWKIEFNTRNTDDR